jgi:6-phosphogluconolactonase
MNTPLPFLVFVLLCSAASAKQFLLMSANKDTALGSYLVKPGRGELSLYDQVSLPGNGGPIAVSEDERFCYVEARIKPEGEKKEVPHLLTFALENGELRKVGQVEAKYRACALHVDVTGMRLFAAHYSPNVIHSWEIGKDRVLSGKLVQEVKVEEHNHFVTTDPTGRFLYVPHTSPNAIFQFALGYDGMLSPMDPLKALGPDEDHRYHQPRHLAHHPILHCAYSSNERGGGISMWKHNPRNGQLKLRQTLTTLPEGYPEKGGAAADIHITPDGKFAYVSNRDYTKRTEGEAPKSTIAGFAINESSGRLEPIGHFPTEHAPRSFCIDRTGRFMYVAGQHTDKLAGYMIDPETGELTLVQTYNTPKEPIWVTVVNDHVEE